MAVLSGGWVTVGWEVAAGCGDAVGGGLWIGANVLFNRGPEREPKAPPPGIVRAQEPRKGFALSAASAFGVGANLVLLTQRSARRAAIIFGVIGAVLLVFIGNFEAPLEVAYAGHQGSDEFWQQLDILDLNQPPE